MFDSVIRTECSLGFPQGNAFAVVVQLPSLVGLSATFVSLLFRGKQILGGGIQPILLLSKCKS